MENREFLPIGSVVLLKGGEKKVMITGFCMTPNENKHKIYDYSGCLYPEGIVNSNEIFLFDNKQIAEVYFKGYIDEEESDFKSELKETIKELKVDDDNNIVSENLSDTISVIENPFDLNQTFEPKINIFE